MVGDNVNKVEINAHDGAQINIALGNGIVNAEQNNSYENSNNSPKNPIIFQNNKKQDYIKNWNSRMFLHVDNEENPITLADAFIMPDYKIYKSVKRIGYSDKDKLSVIIDKFIKYDRTSSMLITGVPGAGKSTITSWISNKYMEDDRVVVLRFRDWDKEVLEKGILKAICTTLICKKEDLNNAILILDGFDEIKSLNNRQKLLDDFFNEINDFNTKYIITSRSSYIRLENFDNTITLLPFNIEKIEHFYKKITGIELKDKSIYNTEILGIPVILYMAIMSRIKIEKKIGRAELYGRIFAKKGGIFDRFCYEGLGYDKGAHVLRSNENISNYLDFLQETAFRMFERNKTSLLLEEYQIPQLKFQGESVSVLEFPIKYLFENTASDIEFIHKSIYDYFVAEYLGEKIFESILMKNVEDSAAILGDILRNNIISDEIAEYLSYKILRKNIIIQRIDLKEYLEMPSHSNVISFLASVFSLMLINGMTGFCIENHKNNIKCEINIFKNILKIVQFCFDCDTKLCVKHKDEFVNYLLLSNLKGDEVILEYVDLSGVKFKDIFMRNITFKGVNLSGTTFENISMNNITFIDVDLSGAEFINANINKTILSNANLEEVVFIDSKFNNSKVISSRVKIKLQNTDLQGTKFRELDIEYLDLSNSNLTNVEFNNNIVRRDTSVILDNAIIALKSVPKAEKILGNKVNTCRIDMCDNILTYKEYIEFRKRKLPELQDEIIDLIKNGNNYSEM